jgi:hypothetical protein
MNKLEEWLLSNSKEFFISQPNVREHFGHLFIHRRWKVHAIRL